MVDEESFMVFVVLGEGGVAGGVVSRAKDVGRMIDDEGGAAMESIMLVCDISEPLWCAFQSAHWATCLDLVRGSR